MTTIACDGRTMAGDGRMTANFVVVTDDAVKVHRLGDGRIVGMSGGSAHKLPLLAWLDANDGTRFDPDYQDGEEHINAIVLHPDGTLDQINPYGRAIRITAPATIGSGCELALGAMMAGLDATAAVAQAMKRDIYSGGTITTLENEQI
jgi:ATP-dependent protease HslVU (ClpYQ) peptidase subunit